MLRKKVVVDQHESKWHRTSFQGDIPDLETEETIRFSRQSATASSHRGPQEEGHEFCITVHHRDNTMSKSHLDDTAPPMSSLDTTTGGTALGWREKGWIHLHGAMCHSYMIGMLFTGCSLALLSQHMANQGMIMNKAQLPAWTRCTLNFLISLCIEIGTAVWWRGRSAPSSGPDGKDGNASLNKLRARPSRMSMKQALALSFVG